ncbi:hypothetical protein PG993_014973 [Apiospora rasikravindrae]|uniref:Uncharacterized protein n=1 Tax=Apiospora rasikravindrae TaxID=990691 RepID=A0ABR1RP95_9PEZI
MTKPLQIGIYQANKDTFTMEHVEDESESLSDYEKRRKKEEARENKLVAATLETYLCLPDSLTNTASRLRSLIKRDRGYIPVSKHHISSWDDFTEENINLIFIDFLERKYPFRRWDLEYAWCSTRRYLDEDQREVAELGTVDETSMWFHMFIWPIVERALRKSSSRFQERVNVHDARDVRARSCGARQELSGKEQRMGVKRPAWPVYYDTESSHQRPSDPSSIVVVGDIREKVAFDPATLADPARINVRVRIILGNILMHCVRSDTRYAFVITGDEVTLLRFFRLEARGKKRYGLNYAVLPWARMEGEMSAWKGIWALTMLSLVDQHRPIVSQDQTRNLDEWTKLTKLGRVFWKNHITKVIRSDGAWADKIRLVEATERLRHLAEYLGPKPPSK